MKFLYIFLICIAGSLNDIQASGEIQTEQNLKKTILLQRLDVKILQIMQDKKRLDDSFSSYHFFTEVPEKHKKIDTFIHELQIYRDAIHLDKKEEANLARKNIRMIKENLEAESKDF